MSEGYSGMAVTRLELRVCFCAEDSLTVLRVARVFDISSY